MSNQAEVKIISEPERLRASRVKLLKRTKIFYGIGQMGDSIPYNLFYIFFLFFLTDVAGISPAIAGRVSLIAILWDAITDPIIGHFSDNLKSPYGRRRPVMLAGALPLGIAVWMLFQTVDVTEGMKSVYYIGTAMLFWTAYTAYVIPYFALGAEITQDFDERNSLRFYASIFLYLAVLIATAGPMVVVGRVVDAGGTVQDGWSTVGLVFGVLTVCVILVCWKFTQGKELKLTLAQMEGKRSFFKTFLRHCRLRPTES